MTDAQKRVYVYDLYSGRNWKKKVERMSDDQITAIYLKHVSEGQKPEHDESEEPESRLDLASTGPGPHANEDDFPMY